MYVFGEYVNVVARPVRPDAHKTAAIFGPSRTPVPEAACALLKAWVAAAGLTAAAKPYVTRSHKSVYSANLARSVTVSEGWVDNDKNDNNIKSSSLERTPLPPRQLTTARLGFLRFRGTAAAA